MTISTTNNFRKKHINPESNNNIPEEDSAILANEELKRLPIKYLTMMLKQYLLRNAQNYRGVGPVVRWFLQLRTQSGMLSGESLMLLLGRDILATQVVKNLELQLTKLVYYNETG